MSAANVIIATLKLADSLNRATVAVARFSATVEGLKETFYPTVPGEWPDEFAVLNRYMRTGRKPRWFSGEMK